MLWVGVSPVAVDSIEVEFPHMGGSAVETELGQHLGGVGAERRCGANGPPRRRTGGESGGTGSVGPANEAATPAMARRAASDRLFERLEARAAAVKPVRGSAMASLQKRARRAQATSPPAAAASSPKPTRPGGALAAVAGDGDPEPRSAGHHVCGHDAELFEGRGRLASMTTSADERGGAAAYGRGLKSRPPIACLR